jgi:outer membrane immunogenic protein
VALTRAISVEGGTLFSESHLHSGWTAGGGLEYGFTPNWSGKVEYMYASYANENYLRAFIRTATRPR